MPPATKQTAKPVFKTSSPFTETKWPEISHDDEEVILALLCNLIAPLGDHRRTHNPSKGKKKRKRTTNTSQTDSTMTEMASTPPPPEIGNHILVGLNSITRHLEALAAQNAPPVYRTSAANLAQQKNKQAKHIPKADEQEQEKDPGQPTQPPLSILILTHPKPALSPAHAHLPTLVHLSTLNPNNTSSSSSHSQTRLIPLPTTSDTRLASTLQIPRVGALAVYAGAPGAQALEDYVRAHVGVTECKWIDEAVRGEWMGMCVKSDVAGGKKE
ncbi:hypothetical protein BDW02DRAFT_631167 [Decorospora gaudefroyi]|uniref:Uncharacterized protein n=1 Tax=Decorospora gaudefroyi TaxID=184978 RepID=A0A6A5KEE7_9PLEO|nr:hypothetical protein BDW02DRAFT_631167 [Decorospora gaudefroyi]